MQILAGSAGLAAEGFECAGGFALLNDEASESDSRDGAGRAGALYAHAREERIDPGPIIAAKQLQTGVATPWT